MRRYDYYSEWSRYAYADEDKRFVTDEELVRELCTCTDLETKYGGGSGIPLLYKNNKIYCIKDGHTLVEGESGSKKSRTIVRDSIISTILTGDSAIITDPKGELSSDPKILGLLREYGYEYPILDFRTFDRDGFNILKYPYELVKEGNASEAMAIISRFVSGLMKEKKTNDDYWNDNAYSLLVHLAEILLTALAQKSDGLRYANIASLIKFVSGEPAELEELMSSLSKAYSNDALHNPADLLKRKIYSTPEKTYNCIISTTLSMMKEFVTQSKLTNMLSISTFDFREAYRKPMVLFIVVPDETSAFDEISGQIIDSLYQQLIAEYTKHYQNKEESKCKIHFICDEFCNLKINGMAAKISASRSRNITWMLIYQSGKQLKETYEKEAGTIVGNCKNYIFLGSSDVDVLNDVSHMCGTTEITHSGREENLMPVSSLRKMKKMREYKDALFVRDSVIYCAKLPDYEQFKFLDKYQNSKTIFSNKLKSVGVYKPMDLLLDIELGKVVFTHKK